MGELERPMENLELADGESRELEVVRYQVGVTTIVPRYPGAPGSKLVEAVRLFVRPGTKAAGTDYWDVTQGTLVYTLKGIMAGRSLPVKLRIAAIGEGPKKRYSVAVL